jgi:hypothetical protein
VLDILQALSYKLENLRNKIRYIEQLETSTSTTTTTKIVSAVLQMQFDIAALFSGQKTQHAGYNTHIPTNQYTTDPLANLNLIDLTETQKPTEEDHPMTIASAGPSTRGPSPLTNKNPPGIPTTKGKEVINNTNTTGPALTKPTPIRAQPKASQTQEPVESAEAILAR